MKAKLSKKLLSIGLSVLMAVSVLPLSLISTNAVTCNINHKVIFDYLFKSSYMPV